jgi:hypothetical protein
MLGDDIDDMHSTSVKLGDDIDDMPGGMHSTHSTSVKRDYDGDGNLSDGMQDGVRDGAQDGASASASSFVVYDVWADKVVPSRADGFSATVAPHDIGVFRVRKGP